jgi:hypothetical protein
VPEQMHGTPRRRRAGSDRLFPLASTTGPGGGASSQPVATVHGWRGRLDPRTGWLLVLLLVCGVAALHAGLVAGHYVVGSFDDDGHYLALAKAFATGKGYVDTSAPGAPIESLYPPGYPLVIAPLVWLFSAAVLPLRLLSAAAFVGCIPMLDILLRRRRIRPVVRTAVLLLFALNPVGATFATEVMPESVFLLIFLTVLVALPRWESDRRILTWSGAAVLVGAPALLLFKAAGLPMLIGVGLWLLLRRHWRKLAALIASSVLLVSPLVIARMLAGPVVGTRYTDAYRITGGLLPTLWHHSVAYVNDAIPATLVPTSGVNLLGHSIALDAALAAVRFTAAPLVAIGCWRWLRQERDVSATIIPLYLVETLLFPYINERRVILVLPWVVTWYVLGWVTVVRAVGRTRPVATRRFAAPAIAALPALAVVGLLVWQLPRDYLLRLGETTPAARGSGYVAALRAVTPPGWSIATGYRWTIADLTGRTASNAVHFSFDCPPSGPPGDIPTLRTDLSQQHVSTVLDAILKFPGAIDNACLFGTMQRAPWAVPVYTGSDASTVFVLLGAGTPRPGLTVAARIPADVPATVRLPNEAEVRELSVELVGSAADVSFQLRRPDGRWTTVAADSSGGVPALFDAAVPPGTRATAVRVVGADSGSLRNLVVLASGG